MDRISERIEVDTVEIWRIINIIEDDPHPIHLHWFYSVQNTIRRIIESYFKVFGNYDDDDIISLFEDEEKLICKALVSWINDGSHFANDNLYTECSVDTVTKYLKVFEKIFEVTGHHSHYRMMMGVSNQTLHK